jgi:poly(3-hydroxybutyrate) depolymerase
MTSARLFAVIAALGMLSAVGCSANESDMSSGSGGGMGAGTGGGTAGTSAQGGMTGSAGAPGIGGAPGLGGAGAGGAAVPGTGGRGGGGSGAGGAALGGANGAGGPGNYPLGNAPVRSAGCNTQGMGPLVAGATSVANGFPTSKRLKIMSGGADREYIIDIPADYDATKPYRLFLAFHWIGSTDTAVATGSVTNGGATNWGFYGLHREAAVANVPAIFVAPQALPGNPGGTWSTSQPTDQTFVDDILSKLEASLCIDTSRVFATGFSFGAMMTYSLSTTHQNVIRAAVGIAPANFNIYLPNPVPRAPIAWMSTTGMGDGTCPWDASATLRHGAKYIALDRGQDNGCMVPTAIPTWSSSSPARHICYDFQGCKTNYPVKACTFNGIHQAAPFDSGAGDNGLTSWVPTESWSFFAQF